MAMEVGVYLQWIVYKSLRYQFLLSVSVNRKVCNCIDTWGTRHNNGMNMCAMICYDLVIIFRRRMYNLRGLLTFTSFYLFKIDKTSKMYTVDSIFAKSMVIKRFEVMFFKPDVSFSYLILGIPKKLYIPNSTSLVPTARLLNLAPTSSPNLRLSFTLLLLVRL